MSKGTINKVMILGRLGSDPEVRYMPSGSAVATINVATNDGYKDKQTGQFVETTEWHRIVLFNRKAEIAGEYLRKGSSVFVEGRIRTNKWQDKSGQDRYTTEIVATDMQFIGGRNDGGMAPQGGVQQNQRPQQQQQQRQQAQQQPPAPQMESFEQAFDDDEIPF